jgi:hypothetical protein
MLWPNGASSPVRPPTVLRCRGGHVPNARHRCLGKLFRIARIQSPRRGQEIRGRIVAAAHPAVNTDRVSAAEARLATVPTAACLTVRPGSMTNTDGLAIPPLSLAFNRSHCRTTSRSVSHKRGKRSDNCDRIAADSAIVSTETPTILAPAAEISN